MGGKHVSLTLAVFLSVVIAAIGGFGLMTALIIYAAGHLVDLNTLNKSMERID